jgi:16S rRNA (cytosine967-C5)-methyltransferase
MAGQKFKSARAVAVEVLNKCDPKKDYAGTILDGLRHQTDQNQRATDLVFGTLRNRRAIDTIIAKFSGRPVKSTGRRPLREIQGGLLNIIRVGTYELLYCPLTEQYAIVNEAVTSAKATGGAKQSGFVNAVLRQITRHINNRQVPLSEGDPHRILVADVETGCQFDTDFLPDYRINPAEYLGTVFSLPQWLVTGWLAEFGEESTRQICLASNRRPSVYIRPNSLRTTTEALAKKLDAEDVGFEIVDDAGMIRIKSPHDITRLPGFSEGLFTVQDITASKPVKMLNPKQGWKILDLCAAPGTKTTQLAEVTGDLPHEIVKYVISRGEAKIIATDIDNRRLEMVRENITRLGINDVDIVPYEELLNPQSRFDCILLDVPCSNTGVLSRRIETRYRINPEVIKKLSDTQAGLLETAAKLVGPTGKICYSTCSIEKTENSEQIEDFLKQNQNFSLESEQLTLPSAENFDHDGGYVAVLSKSRTEI